MMRASKITLIVSAVLGATTGVLIGNHRGKEAARFLNQGQCIAAGFAAEDFDRRQFKNTDTVRARDAVLLHIRILKQCEQVAPEWDYAYYLGLAYARLGVIEEAAGREGAKHAAFDEARAWFKRSSPYREMTDEELKNKANLSAEAWDDPL